VGLVWSYDPESYAGGSLSTGRASHARQVKGDDRQKGIPWPSRLRLGHEANHPTPKKKYYYETSRK
jgi:hypothetical protein